MLPNVADPKLAPLESPVPAHALVFTGESQISNFTDPRF
jgi:hypothetical protein